MEVFINKTLPYLLMKWTGKIIGFMLGWMLGGPFLAILGIAIGHFFDQGMSLVRTFQYGAQQSRANQERLQTSVFKSTFLVMGYIAKADGRISEAEIQKARQIMGKMQLNNQQVQQAIHWFTEGKDRNFDLDQILAQLRADCQYQHNLLAFFLETQMEAANIHGKIPASKKRVIDYISQRLGFNAFNFSAFDDFIRSQQQYHGGEYRQQHRNYQQAHSRPRQSISDAYSNLGITSSATDTEVKKSYRRLMSRYHPDKLIAQGAPKSKIKEATEKTQKIKESYESICQTRGIR